MIMKNLLKITIYCLFFSFNVSAEKISEVQNIYRKLFQSEKNISQAVTSIQKAFDDSKEKNEILNFIKSSERGIMKGYLSK